MEVKWNTKEREREQTCERDRERETPGKLKTKIEDVEEVVDGD
jgi:hypothetical protein